MADYNINAVTRRVVFTGSAGTGPYSFTFEVLDQNDLAVYFNTTKLTLTTDYTVTINANGTGSVTIVVGTNVPTTPDADDTIIIVGARDIERTTDFVTAGDLRASALNEQLDGLTIFDQQIAEEQKRTLQAPVYDPAHVDDGGTLDMTLPAKAARAGKYLQFNSTTGNPEAGPDSTDITTLADIATDIATLADIEDGTDATDAIQTVAGISSNVTTVAGIAANVSTVAGIQSDVTAVAADATDIGTVATNIASVNTVAGNISEVIAVANDLNEAVSEVETVANDLNEAVSEIETVAASISNVDTVGTNITNVNTVAGNNSNVTTVAGISANVTTVAGISGNVTTVAGISSDVTTVAADGTDIGTVATNIANVNSVAGNATNINNVAGNATNINTVAGISADVTTVAADSADIQAVAADATDIGTVSTNIANVNTVAGSIANVNTTAANITGVNSFAERYRVGTTDPTTSLDEGDLFFNTTDNTYKFYDGTSWQVVNVSGIGSVLDDASPQLGGNLDLNSNDITGTGNLNLTGTVTADGLTVDGDVVVSNGDTSVSSGDDFAKLQLKSIDSSTNSTGVMSEIADVALINFDGASNNHELVIRTNDGLAATGTLRDRIAIASNGDISFYDSTGVTQGLFWDASTQRLGLGTTSPAQLLHVNSTGNVAAAQIQGASHTAKISTDGAGTIFGTTTNGYMLLTTNSAERMRIDSGGNVHVGKTATGIATAGLSLRGDADVAQFTRDGGEPLELNRLTSDGGIVGFYKDGTTVGSISVTGSGTTYNTTSDIRLKTNIEPIDHATDMLMAMNPVSHRWKADPDADAVVGFIAQEMAEIVPEAVSKGDSEDDMWSMDYGRITPVLVAALQDAHKKIEELEARINKMEAE